MCFGGNSASTDRKQTLGAYGDMDKFISRLSTTGSALTTAGQDATSKAVNNASDILSGDPNRVAAATAPEVNTLQKQNEQRLKSITMTGNRGGGTNQATQNMGASTTGAIVDAAAKARAQASELLARTGTAETGQGIGATSAGASTAANLLQGSTDARSQSQKIHDAAVNQWASAVASIFTGGINSPVWNA